MIRTIRLAYAEVDIGDGWACTRFSDGTRYGAHPHDTPEYRALAARCGYGSIMDYCGEHEVAHSFIAEKVYGERSRVISALAHGTVAAPVDILHEEELVLSLQAYARADVLPGSSAPGFAWWRLRDGFRDLMRT